MTRLQAAAIALLVGIAEACIKSLGDGWAGVRNSAWQLKRELEKLHEA